MALGILDLNVIRFGDKVIGPGVQISVLTLSGNPAVVFDKTGQIKKPNPFLTTDYGFDVVLVESDTYDVKVTWKGLSTTVRIEVEPTAVSDTTLIRPMWLSYKDVDSNSVYSFVQFV